jgi:hypothetical protein
MDYSPGGPGISGGPVNTLDEPVLVRETSLSFLSITELNPCIPARDILKAATSICKKPLQAASTCRGNRHFPAALIAMMRQ